jgi:hypothetical protein
MITFLMPVLKIYPETEIGISLEILLDYILNLAVIVELMGKNF